MGNGPSASSGSSPHRKPSNTRPAQVQEPERESITEAVDRPFTFKLERVRALRERKEELAKEGLAASLAIRLRGEAMLRAAAASTEQARGLQRSAAGAAMSAAELQAAQAYLERTERE